MRAARLGRAGPVMRGAVRLCPAPRSARPLSYASRLGWQREARGVVSSGLSCRTASPTQARGCRGPSHTRAIVGASGYLWDASTAPLTCQQHWGRWDRRVAARASRRSVCRGGEYRVCHTVAHTQVLDSDARAVSAVMLVPDCNGVHEFVSGCTGRPAYSGLLL